MGQQPESAAHVDSEQGGSPLPLGVDRKTPVTIWQPVVRRLLVTALGGAALAGIGAISMAHSSYSRTLEPTQDTKAMAGFGTPTEWLAPDKDQHTVQSKTAGGSPSASVNPNPAMRAALLPEHSASDPPFTNDVATPTRPRLDATTALSQPPEASAAPRAAPSGILADGRVVLNVATVTELTTLPGIGQKRALKIVELRTRLKRFRKLSDLLRIKGIGVKSLRKLTPKLVLDPPPTSPPETE